MNTGNNYQICNRCVMDTTDKFITFDENGFCNHCRSAIDLYHTKPFSYSDQEKKVALEQTLEIIKKRGMGKRYDCIIGLSGGVDSSFVAWKVKELGLKPLAVHLDNGWDSELAIKNIENICSILGIDLYTHVINWEEFQKLQLAFLRSSTPDSEIPSDHAIVSVLYQVANQNGIKYIIGGRNIQSEAILPASWSQGHLDWKYIRSINKAFMGGKLKTYPHMSLKKFAWYRFVKGIEWFDLLNYLQYDKENAKTTISEKIGWRDYGRKHCESNYTRIFQEYILPNKFGYDKRRAHYSSLIIAGQLKRQEAIELLQQSLYTNEKAKEDDIAYVTNKLNISRNEFESIMATPARSYWDFPSYGRTWYYRRLLALYKWVRAKK